MKAILLTPIKALDENENLVTVANKGDHVKVLQHFKDTNLVWLEVKRWDFEVVTSFTNIMILDDEKTINEKIIQRLEKQLELLKKNNNPSLTMYAREGIEEIERTLNQLKGGN